MTPDEEPTSGAPAVITPITSMPLPPGVKWMPHEGIEAAGLMRRSKLDEQGRVQLLQSAAEILGSGVDATTKLGSATGLIVGQVQSGKTMSFTTVIGLARDNGFPLVILVAGNKDPLLKQSHDRLARDLDVEGGDGLPQWKMRKNIRPQDAHDEQLIKQTLENWADPTLEPDEKATLLLTVLKQNQRLRGLKDLLEKFNLSSTPVLIIDDEADQASLNTKINLGQESTTYARLQELRRALPCHTYLQYTATPQAPLLINIADTLSPDFVKVLQPGDDYVGGSEFFSRRSPFIRDIPAADIPPPGAFPPDPPASMLEAMRLFFVGLATSRTRRSMLIHPSRLRADHREVVQWVTEAKDEWHRLLQIPSSDPDRMALVDEFREAYDDLATTMADLPAFTEILARLPRALRNTTPIEFNTNGRPKAPDIVWRDAEGWILVGGQAVDRGFTVELLTVTYMPRGVGVGNADTLQQRARFFGYKRRYLGLCRIFLEPVTRTAYENYVDHEEIMRRELQHFADTGESLRTWRRRLVLSADLKPCRKSVISDDFTRARPGGGWSQQRGAEMSADVIASNRAVVQALVNEFSFEPDTTTYVSAERAQQHEFVSAVPLQRIVDMLVDYRLEDAKDTAIFTGILVALGEGLFQHPDATAVVYRMRPNAISERTTTNGLLADGFQQGRTALTGGGTAYPGDNVFMDRARLTLQLHTFDLTHARNGPVMVPAAPLIAIHLPSVLAKAWLVQIQAGQVTAA
jgi:hypothetical protein